jgi:hypothetical protein
MAVPSEGNTYGVPSGLVYSFPVVCKVIYNNFEYN